jgi:cell division protein FtsB
MRVKFAMSGGPPVDAGLIERFWPIVTGLGVAAWALIKTAFSERRFSEKSKTELATIAQGAVKDAIQILNEENGRLHREVNELRKEFDHFRDEQARVVLTKDGEITLLRGEIRGILTTALSFQAKLDEAKIPHEKIGAHYWEISGLQLREIEVKTT